MGNLNQNTFIATFKIVPTFTGGPLLGDTAVRSPLPAHVLSVDAVGTEDSVAVGK